MDDILKRLAVAYLGFTAALWAVSGAMALDGSAYPKNYAWVIVSNLRFYFTGPLVVALVFAAGACLFAVVAETRDRQQKALEERGRAERERLKGEERRRQTEVDAQARAKCEALRLAREEKERAEARRREEEEQKQSAIEKQTRSANAAAERALDDF